MEKGQEFLDYLKKAHQLQMCGYSIPTFDKNSSFEEVKMEVEVTLAQIKQKKRKKRDGAYLLMPSLFFKALEALEALEVRHRSNLFLPTKEEFFACETTIKILVNEHQTQKWWNLSFDIHTDRSFDLDRMDVVTNLFDFILLSNETKFAYYFGHREAEQIQRIRASDLVFQFLSRIFLHVSMNQYRYETNIQPLLCSLFPNFISLEDENSYGIKVGFVKWELFNKRIQVKLTHALSDFFPILSLNLLVCDYVFLSSPGK